MIPGEFSSYRHIDPILMAWAKRHGIEVQTEDRGWDIRSFWICDRDGWRRGQLWMRDPDDQGNVTVIASELTPKSSTNWGAREERRASLSSLEGELDDLWSAMLAWGGPGAIVSNYGVYPLNLQHRPPRWGYELGTARFSPRHPWARQVSYWTVLCLALDALTVAFHVAPETSLVGRLAVRAAEAVTIWPLTIFTGLVLPALLFVAIMPKAPFGRVFVGGLIKSALLLAAVTGIFLLHRWRRG